MDEVVRDYEDAIITGQWGTNDTFITYTFATPVQLEAGKVYGVDMSCTGWGFAPVRVDDDVYAWGRSYRSGDVNTNDGYGDSNLVYHVGSDDRVFHLDLTAKTDPTTVIKQWDFNSDGDSENWTGNANLTDTIAVSNGTLNATCAINGDAIIYNSDVVANPAVGGISHLQWRIRITDTNSAVIVPEANGMYNQVGGQIIPGSQPQFWSAQEDGDGFYIVTIDFSSKNLPDNN